MSPIWASGSGVPFTHRNVNESLTRDTRSRLEFGAVADDARTLGERLNPTAILEVRGRDHAVDARPNLVPAQPEASGDPAVGTSVPQELQDLLRARIHLRHRRPDHRASQPGMDAQGDGGRPTVDTCRIIWPTYRPRSPIP